MCLVVDMVPRTKRDGLIVECGKVLKRLEGTYYTPFLGQWVSSKGWLFPLRRGTGRMWRGRKLRGGFIHGMESPCGPRPPWFDCETGRFRAFAFQVEAYDDGDGYPESCLACRAMYIPVADREDGSTLRRILSLMKRRNLRKSSLYSLHPRLKAALA